MVTRNVAVDAFGNEMTNICRIKVVTYQGDGSTSLAITGVGFHPLYVRIWNDVNATVSMPVNERVAEMNTTMSWLTLDGDTDIVDNAIISLDADGFTVDDAGGDAHPNKSGVDYIALCLGV